MMGEQFSDALCLYLVVDYSEYLNVLGDRSLLVSRSTTADPMPSAKLLDETALSLQRGRQS